jgi:hypothetical protein
MTTAGSNFMKTSNKIVGDKNKRNARQTITTHSKYLDQQFSTLDGPGAGHRVSSKKHVRANSTAGNYTTNGIHRGPAAVGAVKPLGNAMNITNSLIISNS